MTGAGIRSARGAAKRGGIAVRLLAPIFWLFLVVSFSLFLSEEAARHAIEGIRLAVMSVIPTAFPCMLICDLYSTFGSPERLRLVGWVFSRLFGISPVGLRAYLLGNLCGFPMGAREAAVAFGRGELDRREAELLIPLSSNPSPSFTVGAVGAVMLGKWRLGVLLLLSTVLSSAVCGVIFRLRRERKKIGVKTEMQAVVIGQRYSFVESVKGAASSSLIIIAFISAFSVLLGFIKEHVTYAPLCALLFSVTEVTGGVGYFAAQSGLSELLRGALIAFTLGFGGISVAVQSAAFISESGLTMRKYLPVKLTQGVIAALFFSLAYSFIPI